MLSVLVFGNKIPKPKNTIPAQIISGPIKLK